MLKVGDFSVELCGGTHVNRAGDIGLFRITSEGGIAAGVRRIEAVTGRKAYTILSNRSGALNTIAQELKTTPDEAQGRVQTLIQDHADTLKEANALRAQLAASSFEEQLANASTLATDPSRGIIYVGSGDTIYSFTKRDN